MKKFNRHIVLLILVLLSGSMLRAQVLHPTVTSAAGDEFTQAPFGSLHWTLGEPLVETLTHGNMLTQGFHQSYYTLVSVSPLLPEELHIKVYPNPFEGEISVEVTPLHAEMTIAIYNVLGQRILEAPLTEAVQTVSLERVSSGTYLLVIRQPSFIYRSLIIEKTSSTH